MSKKIVLSTEVIETRGGGVEVRVVKLSPEAKQALSTAGAEIALPRPAQSQSKPAERKRT